MAVLAQLKHHCKNRTDTGNMSLWKLKLSQSHTRYPLSGVDEV